MQVSYHAVVTGDKPPFAWHLVRGYEGKEGEEALTAPDTSGVSDSVQGAFAAAVKAADRCEDAARRRQTVMRIRLGDYDRPDRVSVDVDPFEIPDHVPDGLVEAFR